MSLHDSAQSNDPVFRDLSKEESYQYLAREDAQPGRIVVRRKDDMDIFPINYATDGENIYFRTAEGTKLFTVRLNADVLFENDGLTDGVAWSVVIKGNAQVITSTAEMVAAEDLNLKPWAPTLKYNWVKVVPTEITGLAFVPAEEPERY